MLVKILFLFIMSVFKFIHLGDFTDVYIHSATCFNAETVEEKRQLQIKRSSPKVGDPFLSKLYNSNNHEK